MCVLCVCVRAHVQQQEAGEEQAGASAQLHKHVGPTAAEGA